MRLQEHGAELFAGAASSVLETLGRILADIPLGQAGMRLHDVPGLNALLMSTGAIGRVAAAALGADARPVRAILFDKSATANWSLPWHQDRTIAVTERKDADGFGPWMIKAGMHHVEPPAHLLARMITMRVHLDAVSSTNAPLLIAPGSHRLGRIPQTDIARIVERCGTVACTAEAGDLWAYSTPIVHASEAAQTPTRRRVLQVDYANAELPGGLRWLGI